MRLLCLLLVLPFTPPQDRAARRFEWKLAPGAGAVFSVLDRSGKPVRDRSFMILASELVPGGNRLAIDRYADLPFPLLFQVPGEDARPGHAWEVATSFFHEAGDTAFPAFGRGGIRPVHARARYVLRAVQKKGEDELATIDGTVVFYEVRRDFVNNQTRVTITKNDVGTLATSVQFSFTRGMIARAGYQLKVRAQERVPDREQTRIEDKTLAAQEILEFKEEARVVSDAVDASIRKAVEYLRKQQKSGGSWAPARSMESSRVQIDSTGLAVRALLAAGVKPEDPALAAAARHLRAGVPTAPQSANHVVAALSLRGPGKEDAPVIRAVAEGLLQRRDPRLGWNAGDRRDIENPISTAHAVEALAMAPDVRVPEEAWRSVIDLYAAGWIEGLKEVELDLEFEKGAATIESEPRKVLPATWAFDSGRKSSNDPLQQQRVPAGGSALTALSALKSLLIASDRLKPDEARRRAIDTALRKGLAWLQGSWTLRTVPPTESSWCRQRTEYLSLVSQVLGRARVVRIAGSEWRADGTLLLLRDQLEDGSWDTGNGVGVMETANCLIFLASTRP